MENLAMSPEEVDDFLSGPLTGQLPPTAPRSDRCGTSGRTTLSGLSAVHGRSCISVSRRTLASRSASISATSTTASLSR